MQNVYNWAFHITLLNTNYLFNAYDTLWCTPNFGEIIFLLNSQSKHVSLDLKCKVIRGMALPSVVLLLATRVQHYTVEKYR